MILNFCDSLTSLAKHKLRQLKNSELPVRLSVPASNNYAVNQPANELLDQAENDVQASVALMKEIREQLKLQMELFKTLWDVKAAAEFQDTVLSVIGKIDPGIRKQILQELNAKSAIRNAVSFR